MRILLLTHICVIVLGMSYNASLRGWLTSGDYNRCLEPHHTSHSVAEQNNQSTKQGSPYTFPKFDEYGDLPLAEEKERLNHFAQELKSVPEEPGYIIEYRRKGQRQKRLARAKRAKDYLVKVKNIDARRILIVDGGDQKEFKIELRLGPVTPK